MKKIFCIMSCLMLFFLIACGIEQQESTERNESPAASDFYEMEEEVSESEYLLERSGEKLTLETEAAVEQIAMQTEREESNMQQIQITVEDQSFAINLYDNAAAKSLVEKLPMTVDMSDLHGNEKYAYLEEGLPTESFVPEAIYAGDLMLFGSDCLVLFYEGFSTTFSYTPLGSVENPVGLAEALGSGEVQVTFRQPVK